MMRDLRPSCVHVARARCVQTALLAAALTLACEDTSRPTQPEVNDFWVLQAVNGDQQVGAAGTLLPVPLTVRVTNSMNRPVVGATIEWVSYNAGSLDATTSTTDEQGTSSVTRTLGSVAGTQIASAAIAGDSSIRVMFVAVALVQGATQITWTPTAHGLDQRDTVRSTLAPFRVLVHDHENEPVAGVVVQWSLSGGGSLSSSSSSTDANGIAQVTHRLGTRVDFSIVYATVIGLIGSPVSFYALSTPGMTVGAAAVGGGQIGRIGVRLEPYRVTTTDAWGNTTPPANVDWAVTSGGGSIVPTGPAIATHTLGPIDGEQIVTATVRNAPGIAPLRFTARALTEYVGVWNGYYCYDSPTFIPANVTVPSGATVGWRWDAQCGQAHSVIFEDDPNPPVSSAISSTGLHLRTFTGAPRKIRFRCTRHSVNFDTGMVGNVTIQ